MRFPTDSESHTFVLGLVFASEVRRDVFLQRTVCPDTGFTDQTEGGLTALAYHTIDTLLKKREGGEGERKEVRERRKGGGEWKRKKE